MFLSIDAVAPVADPEREAGLNQNLREATKVLLHPAPAKAGTLRDDVATAAAAERWCAEHLLPRRDRLLQNVLLDLFMKRVVVTDITLVGDAAVSVAQVLSEREQPGSIA